MPYRHVGLTNPLEQEELGYNVRIGEVEKEYELNPGFVREVENKTRTPIRICSSFIPIMRINYFADRSIRYFNLCYGFGFGFSTRNTASKYLTAVSKKLGQKLV